MKDTDILVIVDYCKLHLDLANASRGEEYSYHSLPLCVIDTVFSLGARYSSTENTVARFCEYFGLQKLSTVRPPVAEQFTISDFVGLYDRHSVEQMTEQVYWNKQRTSTRNGILKSEAVLFFAKVLSKFGVNVYQDMPKILGNADFEAEIAKIPGQRSGISTRYFYMLAGSDDYIKPDRMMLRFLCAATGRIFSVEEAHATILDTHRLLVREFPHLTPKSLDHLIWLYQRGKSLKSNH